MVSPKNGWLVMGIQGVCVTFVVTLIAMGCASPRVSSDTGAESMVQTIGDVSIERDGEDSVIRLSGILDPVYSVSSSEDEGTVVVDLVGVRTATASDFVGGEGSQIAAYDGVIDLVTMSTFDEEAGLPLTRLEVALSGPGQPEVLSTGDGLAIRIIPGPAEMTSASSQANEEEVTGSDVAGTDFSEPDAADWGSSSSERMAEEAEVATTTLLAPTPATQLIGVSAEVTPGGVLLGLRADGEIGNMESFTLENPSRLVIDLPGLGVSGVPVKTAVRSDHVVAVRTGAHDGKVRVVVDGGSSAGNFESRQVMPGPMGLWVAIGQGEELDSAMTNARAEAEARWLAAASREDDAVSAVFSETESVSLVSADDQSTIQEPIAFEVAEEEKEEEASVAPVVDSPKGDPSQVYGLHYERSNGIDRTAILTDEAVTYTTTSPDATTLVVRIPDATISDEASDRIFPQAGGPISLIHAFQQPDLETPEVRVVFTRAPNQAPVVTRRGSMLFVDFQDMGVAAAPPPGFKDVGEDETAVQVAVGSPTPVVEAPMEPGAGNAPRGPSSLSQDMMDGMEIVGGLPSFDAEQRIGALPAAPGLSEEALAAAPQWVGPAAVEVPAAIEVLEEGGLIDGKEYRGRRVSLDFKDVAIADVLRLIAEVSDLNIIAGDEVNGKVTIRLVETPWDQALDVILMTKGLGFLRVGNVLRIAPSDVLKAEEEVRLQERRNKEKLEDLEVKLLPVNYAAVKDTEGLIKRLLSARGTVNLDRRTNTLIIKDISSVIDEASALIAAIDTQTPQVMIEAKIVEANLDFSRELGAVWGISTQNLTDPFDPGSAQRTDLGSEDLTFIDNNSLAFANPITSVATGLGTLGALILDQDFRVDAQIQAAEATGDGKVVSSPRIVTLDNKEARIEQGVSIPFQTFEGGDARLEFIDAVLSLVVTPHITADQSVIMEIKVTRNAPDTTVPTPTGSPAIAKNVAETETLVKDGQTLVLGGIYTINKSKTQTRVPYLHRIPVIGNAFKSNQVTDQRKELLVFVTPRIVRLPEMAYK